MCSFAYQTDKNNTVLNFFDLFCILSKDKSVGEFNSDLSLHIYIVNLTFKLILCDIRNTFKIQYFLKDYTPRIQRQLHEILSNQTNKY